MYIFNNYVKKILEVMTNTSGKMAAMQKLA